LGLRLPFLILTLLTLFTPVVSRAAAKGCRGCHPAHYTNRGTCISCHRGDNRTDRKQIAHYCLIPARYALGTPEKSDEVKQGKQLLEQFGCRRCHSAGKEGTRLAASLDQVGSKTAAELVAAIDRPALHMPEFRFAPAERDALVKYLFWLGQGSREQRGKETPIVIHFDRRERDGEHPFVKRCGGCHKALTRSLGGVGRGSIGPNLSALFTSFYPRPYRAGESWTPELLGKWLKNPRKLRPLTVMPPITLEEGESEQIAQLLHIESTRKR
jgi:cytochrome c2